MTWLKRIALVFLLIAAPELAFGQLTRREQVEPGAGIIFCDDNSVGGNDTYLCTPTPALSAYRTTILVLFKALTNNIGAATLAISGLASPKTIVAFDGSTLANNAIVAGRRYILVMDSTGTNFVLHENASGGGSGLSGLTDDCLLKANGTTAAECSGAFDRGSGNYEFGVVTGFYHRFLFTTATAIRDITFPDLSGTVRYRTNEAYWSAGSITTDGTNCVDATEQTLNGGPKLFAFSCADSVSSVFYGATRLKYALSTATFTLSVYHATTETITLAGDFSAMCRGDGVVIDSTWGTAVAADVAITTAHRNEQQTSGAVTPNGSCTAGAMLFWRYVVDAGNFSPNAANTKVLGVSMDQAS